MASAAEILLMGPQRAAFLGALDETLPRESDNWPMAANGAISELMPGVVNAGAYVAVGAAILFCAALNEMQAKPRKAHKTLAMRADVLDLAETCWARAAQVNWPGIAAHASERSISERFGDTRSHVRSMEATQRALQALERHREAILRQLGFPSRQALEVIALMVGAMCGKPRAPAIRQNGRLNEAQAWEMVRHAAGIAACDAHRAREIKSAGRRDRGPGVPRAWTKALMPVWEQVTARRASHTFDPYSETVSGAFLEFVVDVMRAAGEIATPEQVANALRNLRK